MKTYISLFSSAGIGCYGFKQQQFECIATNELIARRLEIQKYNNKCKYPTGYICGDIKDIVIKEKVFKEIEFWKKNHKIEEVDVVIATPPCQGMSVANHKKNDDEIIRNSLVVESIKIVKEVQPKFFVFENVPAFMKTLCTDIDGIDKPIEKAIQENLGLSYSIYSKVINFKNHGASSSRSRNLVVGVRKDYSDHISPIELFPDYVKEKTVKGTIGHLKGLNRFGEIDESDIYHSFRIYPEHMRKWIENLGEGESAFDNTEIERIPHRVINGEVLYNKRKNGDKYKRQYWGKVGPCIHTRNDQLASQNTIHPSDDRVFSIRELMLMMSIPVEFRWTDISYNDLNNLTDKEKRKFLKKEEMKIRQSIGEAVPTCIFSNIAEKINTFLDKDHLNFRKIKKLIKEKEFYDADAIVKFITENKNRYDISTLAQIAEYSNLERTNNAAYFTNRTLINEVIKELPAFDSENIRILEPSVGVGNFLPAVIKKYAYAKKLTIDVVDIDEQVIVLLKEVLSVIKIPKNVVINYICDDFLLHEFEYSYDLVIGNPPFNKKYSSPQILKGYLKNVENKKTNNIVSFFLEKALKLGKHVALIVPKFILNTPEFKITRDILSKRKVETIIDFGEKGFKGVLVETICLHIVLDEVPTKTNVISLTLNTKKVQKQKYIFDSKLPYWIIYRDKLFDKVFLKMEFDVFSVFRDRQLTNTLMCNNGKIRVIKSRNINDIGTEINEIKGYDAFVSEDIANKLSVFKYYNMENVYLTPNMTYKPRVIRKPLGTLVNGSAAILIPKYEFELSEKQMLYYSSEEYRNFYKVARNFQTRSLNIDSNSVYFFGKLKEM